MKKQIGVIIAVIAVGVGAFFLGHDAWIFAHNPRQAEIAAIIALLMGGGSLIAREIWPGMDPDWKRALDWATFVGPALILLIQMLP